MSMFVAKNFATAWFSILALVAALSPGASFAQSFDEGCKAFATKSPPELGRIIKGKIVAAGEVKLAFGMRGTGRAPAHRVPFAAIEGGIMTSFWSLLRQNCRTACRRLVLHFPGRA